jgi:hypothetical protein
LRERKSGGKRKKLVWTMVALALVVIIALAIVYVNVTNALNSALRSSLNTFALASVAYASANDGTVDMNISLSLENHSAYVLKVTGITLSFRVAGEYIGSLTVMPDQDLSSREKVNFNFVRHVADEEVLTTLHNQTYNLGLKGKISAFASYLFVEAHWDRDIDYIGVVPGIS